MPTGGILDLADVVPVDNFWQPDGGGFPSYNCGPIRTIPGGCDDTPPSKTAENPVWVRGQQFSLYKAISCKSIAFDRNIDNAEAAFRSLEGRGVEAALAALLIADSATVKVSGLTGLNIVCAFAGLAQYAAANYAGQPLYLMSRAAAVRLAAARVLVRENGRLVTPFGDPVAAEGGWDGTGTIQTTAGPWMFAIGQLSLMQSPIQSAEALNTSDNTYTMLVERMYSATIDCNFIAAAPAAACGALP
jgi:hypothetical protein